MHLLMSNTYMPMGYWCWDHRGLKDGDVPDRKGCSQSLLHRYLFMSQEGWGDAHLQSMAELNEVSRLQGRFQALISYVLLKTHACTCHTLQTGGDGKRRTFIGIPCGSLCRGERGIDKSKTNFGNLQTSCWPQGEEVWTDLKNETN